jgi:serine phosphatase RsbU (regulator of sigma subunit)
LTSETGTDVAARPTTSLTVLLVEDDAGDAVLAQEFLIPTASNVEWVGSIAEAVQHLERPWGSPFDCVLLDLDLPDTMGFDGLQRLRAAAPAAALVVLTGDHDEHRGVEAVAAGAQDYLIKNHIDSSLLTRALRYAVERKRAENTAQQWHLAEARQHENSRLERGLLPVPLLHSDSVVVQSRYQPGREQAQLGGDFYDVVEDASGRVWVVIGDVSGHGPDEAALGVALRVGWRSFVLAGLEPQAVFPCLEQLLVAERQHDELFATACMAVLSADGRSAELFLAGHPAPLLIAEAGLAPLGAEGDLPLGILDGHHWSSQSVDLPESWAILWYTDGLIEGLDGSSSSLRFGQSGLRQLVSDLVRTHAAAPDALLLDAMLREVVARNGRPLTDDVAILHLRHEGRG